MPGKPRTYEHFTPEAVTAFMLDSRTYSSADISEHFGVPRELGWHMMRELKLKGLIAKVGRIEGARIWQKVKIEQPEPLTTSIAAPIAGPDLASTMAGYWSEIERRVALCMSVRRYA